MIKVSLFSVREKEREREREREKERSREKGRLLVVCKQRNDERQTEGE